MFICYFIIVQLKRKRKEKCLSKPGLCKNVSAQMVQQFLTVYIQFDGSDRISIL
jgi:hypothetical protein